MNKISLSVLSVFALLGLTACGSDEKPAPQTTVVTAPAGVMSPTKGQELQDLKKSYDDGIISKDEYKEQKARILN